MYSGLQLWSICKACITVQSSRRILATSTHPCIRLTAALQPLALQWPSEFCGLHIARRSISYPPGSRKMSGHKWYSLEIEDHCAAWRLCTRECKVSRPCERLAAVGERHVNQETRRRPSPRGKLLRRSTNNEHMRMSTFFCSAASFRYASSVASWSSGFGILKSVIRLIDMVEKAHSSDKRVGNENRLWKILKTRS